MKELYGNGDEEKRRPKNEGFLDFIVADNSGPWRLIAGPNL